MNTNWPTCPPSLKGIQPILKIATEHDNRDIVVAYWSRVYALQIGLKQSSRQENEMKLLVAMMDWLELIKRQYSDNEAITNEVVAQAHLENYALKLFLYADKQDRSSNWNKNVVKAFFSSAVIYDVLQTFGELTEETAHNRKYAKWKASYIHNCLKNGITPSPGPMSSEQADFEDELSENTIDQNAENAEDFREFKPEPANTNSEPVSPLLPSDGAASIPQPKSLELNINEEQKNDNLPSTSHDLTPGMPPSVLPDPHALLEKKKRTAEQIMQAQKYCKYAVSALNYDDVKAAVENLQSALAVLNAND